MRTGYHTFFLIVGVLIAWADFAAVAVWSANMLAVDLDSQLDERYVTWTFWRLVLMAVGIFPPAVWMAYFSFPKFGGFVFAVALLVTLATVLFQLVLYGWYIVDLINCSSVTHCFGNGTGPFGVDVAFLIVLITTGMEVILSVLLVPVGAIVRGAVHRRRAYSGLYASAATYAASPVSSAPTVQITNMPQSTPVTADALYKRQ